MYLGGDPVFKPDKDAQSRLVAIDVNTGEVQWQYRLKYPMGASVLATGGGLVFAADLEGNALASDASNGELLWSFNTGAGHRGSPITYAVKGRQYVAVPTGMGPFWAGLIPNFFPELADATQGSTLFVFGLFEE